MKKIPLKDEPQKRTKKTQSKKKVEHTCLKCSFIWHSRLENPRACPRCKSYMWMQPRVRKVKA